ncbi:ABC transporter permease [Streptomyces ossamyceticus]|uniref:ABC transporter permease n=1 Tax=Streptomyces ossamyceticus TaxID=249581 RepID=UPI00341EA941
MTALTTTASRPRGGPRGLTWTLLRLHTAAVWFWALLVAVAAGCLLWAAVPGGDAAWTAYTSGGCDNGVVDEGCNLNAPAIELYGTAMYLGSAIINIAPLLIAIWAGAALIGRELENGTAKLAWTQSVTPARWLAAKLALPAGLLTAGTLLLVQLHRIMWQAHDSRWKGAGVWQWHDSQILISNGPVAVAHVLLGLAVGVLIGLLTRRSLASMGYGFFTMGGLLYALELVRPHLWPAKTATNPAATGQPPYIGMTVEEGGITPGGDRVPDLCLMSTDCMPGEDVVGYYRDYHPASHFWPLQLVETGVVLAVTAVLVVLSFRLLRRRTGDAS